MKKLIIGIVLGILIGAPVAWAVATIKLTLITTSGSSIGTTSNPLYVEAI